MKNRIQCVALVGLAIAVVGCSDVQSESLLTSGMSAHITASASGDGNTTVSAVLRAGGALSNVYVELTGDDALTAQRGEEEKPLVRQSLGAFHEYTTDFTGDEPGVDHVVSLVRSVDDGAPSSVMALPDAFEISGPAEFSRAADLTFTWTPAESADAMSVYVDGTCIFGYGETIIGDPGTWTIPAGTIDALEDDPDASCNVTVKVSRTRAGQLDPGFGEGGVAEGVQRREFGVTSAP